MAIEPISVSILMGVFAFGWRQVYLFWFVPILLGVGAVLRIKSEPTEGIRDDAAMMSRSDSLFTLSLTMFLLFLAIRMMAGQMTGAFLPVYLVDEKMLSDALSSLVYGSSFLMRVVAAPVGGLFASRLGEKRWLLTALSLSYFFLALAVTLPNVVAFVAFYLSHGFFNFLGMAANSAIMAQLSSNQRRGLAYALFFLPGSIMGAVAPIFAAHIVEAFGMTSLFVVALAAYVLGLVVLKLGVKI